MYTFVIIIVVIFAFVGGAVGWARNTDKSIMSQIIGAIIGTIISTAIIGGIVMAIYTDGKNNVEQYNNGICPKCGNHFHLATTDKGIFYYECENCHYTIRTTALMN